MNILASKEPDIFIQGLNTAAGKPTVPNLPMLPARPDAIPPFCNPTSKATVRAEFLSSPAALLNQ